MDKDYGAMSVIKMFFQLVKDTDNKYDPVTFLESMPENGVGSITIHGRGGLEVSSHDIKQSPQFAAMQDYALERIRHDSALEEIHLNTQSEMERSKVGATTR